MKELQLIELAMKEAEQSIGKNDEPYGAIITDENGVIIASCGNSENSDCDPTAHGEINAIRAACQKLNRKSLKGCSIYTNYKPCPMCMSAILMTGIDKIYIGSDFTSIENLYQDVIEKVNNADITLVSGINAEECRNQVYRGRETLKENNPDYSSGHKNGIL